MNRLAQIGMLAISFAGATSVAWAQQGARPTGWDVEDLDVGIIWVGEDSQRFGDFTGLEEQGGYLLLDGSARYWGDNGYLWDIEARNLGLDSRELRIEGGKQGLFDVYFDYDELPRYFFDDTLTPFLDLGSPNLTLPANWVRSGSTQTMPALDATSNPVSLNYQRDTLGLGGAVIPDKRSRWKLGLDYRRTERSGSQLFAGAISQVSQFGRPLDDTTDIVNAQAAYGADTWQVNLAYEVSTYDNKNSALRWDNPFTSAPGADAGQHALDPDNDFQQLSLGGSAFLPARTTLTGSLAFGEMSQDDAFLPYTINTLITTPALPRPNLGGKVDTTDVNLRVSSTPLQNFTITGEYRLNKRENDSPIDRYDYVFTDITPASNPAFNVPYSFDKDLILLKFDYRLFRRTRIMAGFEREEIKRDFQERERTEEDKLWARFKGTPHRMVDFSVTGTFEDRDGTTYTPIANVPSPQNPLMSKYNMADRERVGGKLDANIRPHHAITLNLNAELTDDDYINSVIGLLDAERQTAGASLTWATPRNSHVYAMLNWENYESTQANSQAFSNPDWTGDTDDTFQTAIIGITVPELTAKLDLNVDYTYAKSSGEVAVRALGTHSEFPDLETRLSSLKIYLDYRLNDTTTIKFGYWHEKFSSDDWQLDGVFQDTISNLLSLGAQAQSYNQNVLFGSVSFSL